MKIKVILLLVISSVVLIAGFGRTVYAQNRNVLATAERVTGDRFTVAVRTPKGAGVYAVTRPSSTVLNAIDKGLTDLFAVARKHGYYKRLNY